MVGVGRARRGPSEVVLVMVVGEEGCNGTTFVPDLTLIDLI